jgi:hypothetical protein
MESTYNVELNKFIEGCDIVRFVKAQRIRWLGHVKRRSEEWMPKRMLKGTLYSRRKEQPCTKWLDSVMKGIRTWRGRVENPAGWRPVVKAAKAHQGL